MSASAVKEQRRSDRFKAALVQVRDLLETEDLAGCAAVLKAALAGGRTDPAEEGTPQEAFERGFRELCRVNSVPAAFLMAVQADETGDQVHLVTGGVQELVQLVDEAIKAKLAAPPSGPRLWTPGAPA